MKKTVILMMLLMAIVLMAVAMTGCNAVDTLATGVSQKSISGSGTLISSRVGLDATTQTPELYNLFVWGDYTSVVPGDEVMRYEETEDASIFNSESKSKQIKIFYASGDQKRMDKFIEAMQAKLTATETTEEATVTEAVTSASEVTETEATATATEAKTE